MKLRRRESTEAEMSTSANEFVNRQRNKLQRSISRSMDRTSESDDNDKLWGTKADRKDVSSRMKEKHCLCASKDYSTFMICCDFCGVWYHGDCVQVSRTFAKKIEKYYCSLCISNNNSLEIVYKGKKERMPKIEDRKEPVEKKEKRVLLASVSNCVPAIFASKKCGNCIGCLWETNCGKCANCTAPQQQPCLKRICVQAGQILASTPNVTGHSSKKFKYSRSIKREAEDSDSKGSSNSPLHTTSKSGRRVGKANYADSTDSCEKRVKKEKEATNSSISANLAKVYNNYYKQKKRKREEEEKQCLGPSCVNSALLESSYCSDECGLALAERRLKCILPDRIHTFYSQKPASEREDEEKMRLLIESKNALEKEIKSLDDCFENVTNWISTISNQSGSSESTSMDDGSFVVSCAVCALECSMRNIGKHMQRCFVRTEKQSTYGTAQKLPQNPKNLVCDAYNKIDKSYCKRLRVMCSEHYKEEDEIKICGAPLIWFEGKAVEFKQLFVEPEILNEHMFCMDKRKHCNVHSNWAQNALGLIDNERMNILLQLDENNERMRQIKQKRATRGDIISLLCNYTITERDSVLSKINNFTTLLSTDAATNGGNEAQMTNKNTLSSGGQ